MFSQFSHLKHQIERIRLRMIFLAASGLALGAFSPVRAQFGPVAFTADDPTTGSPHMSQSTAGQLQWNGHSLAFVYWEQMLKFDPSIQDYIDEMKPGSPSRIFFRTWTPGSGWSPRVQIDHSNLPSGEEIGGRHPSLLKTATGWFAAWYDARNCTADQNYNNNLELYGNTIANGAPSASDLRLTNSGRNSTGDNRYVPQMVRTPDGRIALAWYDFHWNVDRSEIALRLSGADGIFAGADTLADARLTNDGTRVSADTAKSFTMPAIATDTSGTLYLTWTTGTTDLPSTVYAGRYDPTTSSWLEGPAPLQQNVRGHYDPPRLAAAPDGKTIWMAYVDRETDGSDAIYLRRHRQVDASWSAPIRVAYKPGQPQQYPAPAVDGAGLVHVAYVDRTSANRAVRVLTYDPDRGSVASDILASDTLNGDFLRPAIALDGDGHASVIWEERIDFDHANKLWFWSEIPRSAAAVWREYR